jgi:hypothetical protein
VDRDRAVDEQGNQIGVFGRRGRAPLNGEEQRRMYLRDGKLFTVTDAPPGPAVGGAATDNRGAAGAAAASSGREERR